MSCEPMIKLSPFDPYQTAAYRTTTSTPKIPLSLSSTVTDIHSHHWCILLFRLPHTVSAVILPLIAPPPVLKIRTFSSRIKRIVAIYETSIHRSIHEACLRELEVVKNVLLL